MGQQTGLDFRRWLLDETLALAGNYKGGVFMRLVAASYKLAPVSDPAAVPAFQELARKMSRQNDFLRHDYNFIPSSGDHYASFKQLRRAIDAQRRSGRRRADMYVYAEPPGPEGDASQSGHPVFSNVQNVMIRGVHDAIAHLGGDHPFSARGEYAAYNRHLKTLCNVRDARAGRCLAAAALFTEIVGQTSYYYVYGQYAPQKVVILADFDHYNVGLLSPSSRLNGFFYLRGKDLVCRPDFDPEVFSRDFPALSQELARQVGGPKISLAPLPVKISRFERSDRSPTQQVHGMDRSR
jgi:hypothetical protein